MRALDIEPEEVTNRQDEEETRQVGFWKSRIQSAYGLDMFKKHRDTKEEAKKFYQGEFFAQKDLDAWSGDTVKANLLHRSINFMAEAAYAQHPNVRVTGRKNSKYPDSVLWAENIQKHIEYVFEECKQDKEIKKTWKDSYFGNFSAAKINYDKKRGLFSSKWVAGDIIFDPDAHGDTRRARWWAERVEIPRYRVWQEESFDPKRRTELKKMGSGSNIEYNNAVDGTKTVATDKEVVWYIISKEGIDPFNEMPRVVLLVLAENYDKWLLKQDNPYPYLDDDEIPYPVMQLDILPGEPIGVPYFKVVKSIVEAFNWAASYHMSDMRKTATRPIAYDKNKIDDPAVLNSRKQMMKIGVDGSPKDVLQALDIGQSDKTIFDSVQFFYNLLDQVTGIDEIARGEEGRTKTATESQILNQNSSVAMKGPQGALDEFLIDLVRMIGLASVYYIPAFSIIENPQFNPMAQPTQMVDPATGMPLFNNGTPMMQPPDPMVTSKFLTKQVVQQPVLDPMGMPGMDMATGQPMMQKVVQPIPAPDATGPVKGIDYFHGDDVAMNWPTIPFEEIKCEFVFKIEAGSSSQQKRFERNRVALELFKILGAEYRQLGLWDQFYELIAYLATTFDVPDLNKLLPPKAQFVQQAMNAQMMAMQQGQENGPEKAKPGEFSESKNEGKDFPVNEG